LVEQSQVQACIYICCILWLCSLIFWLLLEAAVVILLHIT
jgi:hypothetical protein